MGLIQLSEYRDDVNRALGELALEDPDVNRYVNNAYYDIAGSIDFEILEEIDESKSTTTGVAHVVYPEGAILIKQVKDTLNGLLLTYTQKEEHFRKQYLTTGAPKSWTAHKNTIRFAPTPNAAIPLLIVFKKLPEPLIGDGDVSVFPHHWDQPIFLLSVHYAFLALGQEVRASVWLARAIASIQSRITDHDFFISTASLGQTVPAGAENLIKQLQGIQGRGGA